MELCQKRPDQTNGRVFVGEDPGDPFSSSDRFVQTFLGVGGSKPGSVFSRERQDGQGLLEPFLEAIHGFGRFVLESLEDLVPDLPGFFLRIGPKELRKGQHQGSSLGGEDLGGHGRGSNVDGFNFYYGVVRGTPWKWLDLVALFRKVLGPQNMLAKIKYFTARLQSSLNDPTVQDRQDAYLPALQAHGPMVELYYGHFLRHQISMEHANPPPPSVKVWKNEEKGSDVNLSLHVLNDAWQNAYDCAVSVSNDSDLAESLRLVKAQNRKLIGLVTPGAPGARLRASSNSMRTS